MLGENDIVAFVATTDLARARAFYGDTLGLTLVADDAYARTFDAHGTMLRLSLVGDAAIAPYTVLGWSVPDVEAAVRTLVSRGVVFQRFEAMEQDDLGVWLAPGGARVAWFKDPDGNVLSVTEA